MRHIVPSELKTKGGVCYGKCLVKLTVSKQWRKGIMHGSPLYATYDIDIEPCAEFPSGGMRRFSADLRWNDADISDIRLVPDEMWGLPVEQDKLTGNELLVLKLRKRLSSGETVAGESEKSRADDWKIVRIGNDSKYGRIAYSPSLDIIRTLTMGEFYGDGVVD